MIRASLIAWMVVCLVALWAPNAHAGPMLDQATAAYDRVEYAEVVRLLGEGLRSETLTATELERAYAMLGASLLGDGQTELAERAYHTLLALRPDYHAEPNAPPKVVEMLKRVRALGVVESKIVPNPLPLASGDGILVRAEMHASSPLVPVVEYRLGGAPPSRVRLSCNGAQCETKLPASTESYRLGFLTNEGAFALATSDVRIASRASAATGSRTPVYKKWWLWTIVGVVVVGGVTGAAVGATLSQKAAHSIDFAIKKDCGGTAVCGLWGP
jgi:hypothetical protein